MELLKWDFSLKSWVLSPGVDLAEGAEVKSKLFQNKVMLLIKLKITTHAATW